jgi:membrane protease YdiL (CAAX protease family)
MSFLGAAMWTIGVVFAVPFVVSITESARPGASNDLVNIVLCIVLVESAILLAMLLVYAPTKSVRAVLGIRATSAPAALLSLASGAFLYPALSWVDDLLLKRFPKSEEDTERLARLLAVHTRGERVALFVALVLVLPIFDELLFRGMFYGGLRRGRVSSLAIVGTALLFAVASGEWRDLPVYLVVGILLAWLRSRSGSLVPSMLAHCAYEAVPVVLLLQGHDDATFPRSWIAGAVAGVAVTVGVATAIYARSEAALMGRLDDG